jgi:hypothetical protein
MRKEWEKNWENSGTRMRKEWENSWKRMGK